MLSALQTCSITHACSPTLIYTLRNHHTPHHRHSFRSKPHAVSLSTHHIAAGCKLQPAARKLPLAAPMCLWWLKAFQRLGQHTGCTACVFTHTHSWSEPPTWALGVQLQCVCGSADMGSTWLNQPTTGTNKLHAQHKNQCKPTKTTQLNWRNAPTPALAQGKYHKEAASTAKASLKSGTTDVPRTTSPC